MSNDKVSSPDVGEVPAGNDLDQLRTILFGNQARAIEQRLNELERNLEAARQELNQHFEERIDALDKSTTADLADAKKAFDEQLTKQTAAQAKQNEKLQAQLDKLVADFNKQLQTVQKELSQQINKQASNFQSKLLDFQAEARQRDDDLRSEILALGAMLDNQKTGRAELAQMFQQISEQLQDNVKKTAVSSSKKSK